MFDDLAGVIGTLRKRVQDFSYHIGTYETRTRVALIDPLLCALGWDVADPRAVEIETKTTNGWADYALLSQTGQPLVFVEAKKLNEPEPPISQVVGYATEENTKGANVRYCVCTNGDYWLLIDIRSQQPVIMRTSIVQESTPKVALKLLGLWRSSLMDGVYASPVEPLATKFEDISKPVPPKPDIVSTTPWSDTEWTSLESGFAAVGQPPPTRLRLPDNTEVETKRWRHIIIETTGWLFSKGALSRDRWSIPFGKKHLFSDNGKNPATKKSFYNPHSIGEGTLYVETSLGNDEMIRYTKEILKRCGYDPSTVHLELATKSGH